jgi:hypothetical protein
MGLGGVNPAGLRPLPSLAPTTDESILRLVGPGPWALGWAIRREESLRSPRERKPKRERPWPWPSPEHTHTRAHAQPPCPPRRRRASAASWTRTSPPPTTSPPRRRSPSCCAASATSSAPPSAASRRSSPPRPRHGSRAPRGPAPRSAASAAQQQVRSLGSARLASPPSLAEEYTPGAPSALSDPPPRVPFFFQAEPSPRRTRGRGRCGTSACPRSCGRSNVSAPFGSTRVSVSSSLPLSLLPWVPTRQLYCIEILHWNACDKSCLL